MGVTRSRVFAGCCSSVVSVKGSSAWSGLKGKGMHGVHGEVLTTAGPGWTTLEASSTACVFDTHRKK
jgi:hypothetical protein